jgi:decaprenylphospho-beta-D-ribofuranose 2-oxidase
MTTTPPLDRLERVAAWGGSTSSLAYVWRPSTIDGVHEAFDAAKRHDLSIGLRGAGQSYGDAALNAEQIVLDCSRLNRILDWNPDTGVLRAEPGVTIRQVWQYTIEDGWWPYVVPGTMAVSLGGATAMNIHGKNNFKVGTIGDHVRAIDLLLPTGEVCRCTRESNADLFFAAIGGFGMLGVVTAVELELKRVHSGLLTVDPIIVPDLRRMLDTFDERRDQADYLVGWLDAHATGPTLGRGLIHQANYLAAGDDPRPRETLRVANQELPPTLFGVLPKSSMWRFMRPLTNRPGVRAVNATKYLMSQLGIDGGQAYRQSHVGFAFLLDYVPDWKRAYGPGGLIQYQSFIPRATAEDAYREILRRAQHAKLPPFLGVVKRHRPDPFLMTHAVDGFSLALDFQITASNRDRVWALCRDLDRIVVEAGGRFYFAKDSTLSPASLEAYLREERVQQFRAIKARVDPEGRLQTNLYRRLFVAGG